MAVLPSPGLLPFPGLLPGASGLPASGSMDSQFDGLNDFFTAEQAVQAHLKKWINTYLSARERKAGIVPGAISRPNTWFTAQNFALLPGYEWTPAIVTVSNGLLERPRVHGDGRVDIKLRMAIAPLVHGAEVSDARAVCGHYQAAILSLMMIQKKIDNTDARVHEWLDMKMEDIPPEQSRTLCVCRMEFAVIFRDFLSMTGGLAAVPPEPHDPQPDLPTVKSIDIEVDKA